MIRSNFRVFFTTQVSCALAFVPLPYTKAAKMQILEKNTETQEELQIMQEHLQYLISIFYTSRWPEK